MAQLLADTKHSIDRFLDEAKTCAEKECGFAAMLTAFSVILGVAEAVKGPVGAEVLLEWFVSQMDDATSWLVLPDSLSFTEAGIGKKLKETRHSLSHQFSLPSDVVLVNSIVQVRGRRERNPGKYFIGTQEFAAAVRSTVDKIVESSGGAAFDPDPRGTTRGVADRVRPVAGSPEESGMSASVSMSVTLVSSEKESENGAA